MTEFIECPPYANQSLTGMPSTAAKPGSHGVPLRQPASATWAVSGPNRPRAVVRGSPHPPVSRSHDVLPVEYHVLGRPSLKNLYKAYNETGIKIYAAFGWEDTHTDADRKNAHGPKTLGCVKLDIHQVVQRALDSG